MTIATVIIQVCFNYFGVPIEMKDSKTRKHEVVQARQFAMFFLMAFILILCS